MFFTTFWQELKKGKNQPRLQPQRNKKLFHYRIAHQKTSTKRTLHPMTRKVIIFAALAACLVGVAHADWVCSNHYLSLPYKAHNVHQDPPGSDVVAFEPYRQSKQH